MAEIGLVIRAGVPEALTLGKELCAWGAKHAHIIVPETETAKLINFSGGSFSAEELITRADPIVTLGGDGTLIGVARYVGKASPLLLGVNFGTLGFLTETYPNELFESLELALKGKALLGERSLLFAQVLRGGKVLLESQAVNDVVVQKGVREKLLELDLAVNSERVMRLRGDGLIMGTPTGSTAYSLAAGGSIVHPSLSVVLVTPICPHSLTNRPFILPLERELEISIPHFMGRAFIIVDGQLSVQLQQGDMVKVSKSVHRVKFLRSSKRSYFEILRGKLNWGVGNSA